MKKHILITGCTGIIGKQVLNHIKKTKYQTKYLIRNKKDLSIKKSDIINFSLEKGFPKINIPPSTTLIHLAWGNVRKPNDKNHLNNELDIQFEFLKQAVSRGIEKIIVAGSCYEYGLVFGPIDINYPTNPITYYGKAKMKLYERLKNLQLEKKFNLLWTRIFYLYGDDDNAGNIISIFDEAVRNGNKKFPMTQGEQLLDYLHVSDVAKKIIKLIELKNGTYNICSGNPISIRRFIEERRKKKKSNIQLEIGKYPYRDNESLAFWGVPNV